MIQTLFGAVEQEPNLLERLKAGIQKTRSGLLDRLEDVVAGRKEIDADLLDELEYALITADIGVNTASEVLESIRQRADRKQLADAGEIKQLIAQHLLEVLEAAERPVPHVAEPPAVVMVVGVNGAGKTTTIGKLASRYKSEGRSVLLCAADTFRAAAIEQLQVWGTRTSTDVIKQSPGADPSAVVFDALQAAKARKVDYVIVDTAGRLHTKTNLMAELEKMRRTAAKVIPSAPHEVLLVLDATTGQNGLEQARKFTESSGVTGLVLTKLDGTAKGGVVVAIARELNLPIRYVGVGEKAGDLLPFEPDKFIASLFAEHDEMMRPFMDEALELARQGLGRTSPNPVVGAVLVKDGQIVGRGFHTYARAKHAEMIALEEAGAQARGATLYITLEPCSHHGRTPPCADALVARGRGAAWWRPWKIPIPQVAGEGFRRLREAGVDVEIASEYSDEAARLNEAFVHFMRTGLPLVTLKAALTLDGKIAAPEDNTGWITSERARAHVQQIRHNSDAILTGIGTVLADDCLLTDRTGLRAQPAAAAHRGRFHAAYSARFAHDRERQRRCGRDHHFGRFRRAPPRAGIPGRARAGVRWPRAAARISPSCPALAASQQYRSLMIESGSKMNWAALEAGIVDKIFFYYAPKILGGLQSLPVAGGTGRLRRTDAIQLHASGCIPSRRTNSPWKPTS